MFEKPTIAGRVSSIPVAINTMGSQSRMAMALGIGSVDELAHQMQLILKAKPPTGMREAWTLLRQGIDLLHARPRHVSDGPCKEVIHRFDGSRSEEAAFTLDHLPVLKCWPKDGGRFITLPNVHTRDPETGERNVGMYRMQIYDGRTTGMHWQVHKVGARHGKRYYERGEPMPVAVTLGGDPAMTFRATAPLPDGLDEVLFAGFVRKKSIDWSNARPSTSRFPRTPISCSRATSSPERCGPRAHSAITPAFTRRMDDYPVFHLTAITHRKDAVYPATIVGIPPMEDFYMGTASVRVFLPVFRMNFPEIVDMALPAEGVFHNLVFVSIRKQYPWQAYKIMHGLWGMGQMMFSKIHRRGGRRLRRPQHQRGPLPPLRKHRSTAGQHIHQEPVRRAGPRADRADHRLAHGHSTPRGSFPPKATRASGRSC